MLSDNQVGQHLLNVLFMIFLVYIEGNIVLVVYSNVNTIAIEFNILFMVSRTAVIVIIKKSNPNPKYKTKYRTNNHGRNTK